MAKDGGAGAGGKMAVPIDKIEELGNHWYKYYQLEHSFFKSSTDNIILEQLWNEYWLTTLSTSPFLNNQAEITNSVLDINTKMEAQSKDAGNAMSIAKQGGQFQGGGRRKGGGKKGMGGIMSGIVDEDYGGGLMGAMGGAGDGGKST